MQTFFVAGYIGERPAAEGVPKLIRIIDEDDGNSLASYVSSDDENVLRGPIGVVFNDVDVSDLSFGEVPDYVFENQGVVYDEEDFETDSSSFWISCISEDSEYDSTFSEGEVCSSVGRISPFDLWDLQESLAEDSDSSASGPGTSRKRSREESEGSQSDATRPRETCEESFGEGQFSPKPPPSTSGLSFPQRKNSEGWDPTWPGGDSEAIMHYVDFIVKRARWDDSSDSD